MTIERAGACRIDSGVWDTVRFTEGKIRHGEDAGFVRLGWVIAALYDFERNADSRWWRVESRRAAKIGVDRWIRLMKLVIMVGF